MNLKRFKRLWEAFGQYLRTLGLRRPRKTCPWCQLVHQVETHGKRRGLFREDPIIE